MSNIGFIGLGIMGRPMAANLIAGGGGRDHSAMVRVLERLACHEIGHAAVAR